MLDDERKAVLKIVEMYNGCPIIWMHTFVISYCFTGTLTLKEKENTTWGFKMAVILGSHEKSKLG